MTINIREVNTKRELKQFIKFPFKLYKDNPYYVTPLIDFEMSTLSREKNPAFDHADAKYWIAEDHGEIVGRIAAIALDQELKEKSLARFGWIDFIDNTAVSSALLDTAKEWSQSKGASSIHGPMGFSDLDFEGALTSGYDELATQATIYNFPYYINHFEEWGMEIAATWTENRLKLPKQVPERIAKGARIVAQRNNLTVKKFKNAKEIIKYAPGVFNVLNAAYSDLYGYHPLTPKQIDYYVDQYFGFIRKEFVCIIVDKEDEVVGFALSLPSISKALQKAKGSLFPFGFIHVLKAFKLNKHVDLFLIGLMPEYQKSGASAMLIEYLTRTYIEKGMEYLTSGPMLLDNSRVQIAWKDYDLLPAKIRRSCYIKHF